MSIKSRNIDFLYMTRYSNAYSDIYTTYYTTNCTTKKKNRMQILRYAYGYINEPP